MATVLLWIAGLVILSFGFVTFFGAPYVPTRRKQVDEAFDELYALGKDDVLVDVGSGDGKLLRAASARGARAIGYELNPLLVALAKSLSKDDARVEVYCRNFWRQKLPKEVTVVYAFLETRDIAKMEQYLQKQAKDRKEPLYFISYGFKLPKAPIKKQYKALFLYEF
jgi:hypothetical protein